MRSQIYRGAGTVISTDKKTATITVPNDYNNNRVTQLAIIVIGNSNSSGLFIS